MTALDREAWADLPTYHFPKERLRAVAPDSVSIRDFEERGGA